MYREDDFLNGVILMKKLYLASFSAMLFTGTVLAQQSQVTMELLDANGNTSIGSISLQKKLHPKSDRHLPLNKINNT